jgi:hypothetical protein
MIDALWSNVRVTLPGVVPVLLTDEKFMPAFKQNICASSCVSSCDVTVTECEGLEKHHHYHYTFTSIFNTTVIILCYLKLSLNCLCFGHSWPPASGNCSLPFSFFTQQNTFPWGCHSFICMCGTSSFLQCLFCVLYVAIWMLVWVYHNHFVCPISMYPCNAFSWVCVTLL